MDYLKALDLKCCDIVSQTPFSLFCFATVFLKCHLSSLPLVAGWSLGEHGEWAKYSNFDVATRVPLIFYIPGITTLDGWLAESTFPFIDVLTQPDYSFRSKTLH